MMKSVKDLAKFNFFLPLKNLDFQFIFFLGFDHLSQYRSRTVNKKAKKAKMAKLSWHPDENVRADDLKKYIAIFQKL